LAIGQDLDHLKKANDVGLKTTDNSYIVIDPVNGQTSFHGFSRVAMQSNPSNLNRLSKQLQPVNGQQPVWMNT